MYIWVNCCSIISQVIIYLKVLKRLISILNLALFCLTLSVALLVVDLSSSQSFMLCVAQHLELLCLFLICLRLILSSFVLLNTSSRSISVALACSTPRVALLVVDFLHFCYSVFTSTQPSHAVFKKACAEHPAGKWSPLDRWALERNHWDHVTVRKLGICK